MKIIKMQKIKSHVDHSCALCEGTSSDGNVYQYCISYKQGVDTLHRITKESFCRKQCMIDYAVLHAFFPCARRL